MSGKINVILSAGGFGLHALYRRLSKGRHPNSHYYHCCIFPTDAIQVQKHVQVTAHLSKAIH